MDLDEAIKHTKEKAQELKGTKCGAEHLQLYKWLQELKEWRKIAEKEGECLIKSDYLEKAHRYLKNTYPQNLRNDIKLAVTQGYQNGFEAGLKYAFENCLIDINKKDDKRKIDECFEMEKKLLELEIEKMNKI